MSEPTTLLEAVIVEKPKTIRVYFVVYRYTVDSEWMADRFAATPEEAWKYHRRYKSEVDYDQTVMLTIELPI